MDTEAGVRQWRWLGVLVVGGLLAGLVGLTLSNDLVQLAGSATAAFALLLLVVLLILLNGLVGIRSKQTTAVVFAVSLIALTVSFTALIAWGGGSADTRSITVTDVAGQPGDATTLTDQDLDSYPALETAIDHYVENCEPAGATECTVDVNEREFDRAKEFLAGGAVVEYHDSYYAIWFGA